MRIAALLLLLATAAPAAAQEPSGCDKFAWPIEAERVALTSETRQKPAADSLLDRASPVAIAMPLAPFAEAKLARPPERQPKREGSFAGSVSFAAGSHGEYKVTLSATGWIDVIQGDAYLKPIAFTGAVDCDGIRKSVKFRIAPGPFILQVSDVGEPTIAVVLTLSN